MRDIVCVQRILNGLLFEARPMDSPSLLNVHCCTRVNVNDTGIALSVFASP